MGNNRNKYYIYIYIIVIYINKFNQYFYCRKYT